MPRPEASAFLSAPRLASIFALIACLLAASDARAAATLGFVEHWTGTTTNSWGGGATYSNPGTGGVHGVGDGYLVMSTPGPGGSSLGAVSTAAQWTGNWPAAGITEVRFWLNDVGNADPLEIHFAIGNASAGGAPGNFWQYNTGFIPPLHAWAQFTVNLTSSAAFTHIIDDPVGGTFAQAMQTVNRVLIRHDKAPYVQSPDPLNATVGIDELLLTNGIVGVEDPAPVAAHPVELAAPFPNPSRGPVALALQAFEDAPISIQVVDVSGRVIRHATLAAAAPGSRIWTWDGMTDDGRVATPGYYRARAFGPSGGMSRAIVRL